MNPEPVVILSDERMLAHVAGPGHPERPDRLRSLLDSLRDSPIPGTVFRRAEPAAEHALSRTHAPEYVRRILELRGKSAQLDPDTGVCPDSVDAALLAAGCAIEAARLAFSGESRAFALVRPPGHHAEYDRAMGFCLFNNIAVAADFARAELAAERVMIVDFDVHHGNGTQHIFEDRSDVLVFSIQQRMIYPGSGAMQEVGNAAGRGFTVNLPLPAGCGDAAYRHAVEQLAGPIAARFRPDLILVSAGFDAHELDPLGGMDVSDAGFGRMMEILIEVAESHCRGRIAAVLEGGYSLEGLTGGVRACLEAMTGRSFASAAAGAADDGVAGLIGRLLREHPLVSG